MLVALLAMYLQAGTTDIPTLLATDFSYSMQFWLWLALFASFAVKIPMWPVHTWLPDAHVEAPTAGSVILAGVLLKMGGYGRSEEHTSELQSLMRISYAVFCLKKKTPHDTHMYARHQFSNLKYDI